MEQELDVMVEKWAEQWMPTTLKHVIKQCALEWAAKVQRDYDDYKKAYIVHTNALGQMERDEALLKDVAALKQDRDQWKARVESKDRVIKTLEESRTRLLEACQEAQDLISKTQLEVDESIKHLPRIKALSMALRMQSAPMAQNKKSSSPPNGRRHGRRH